MADIQILELEATEMPRGYIHIGDVRLGFGLRDEGDEYIRKVLDPDRPTVVVWKLTDRSPPWDALWNAMAAHYPRHDLYLYTTNRKPPMLIQRGRLD